MPSIISTLLLGTRLIRMKKTPNQMIIIEAVFKAATAIAIAEATATVSTATPEHKRIILFIK